MSDLLSNNYLQPPTAAEAAISHMHQKLGGIICENENLVKQRFFCLDNIIVYLATNTKASTETPYKLQIQTTKLPT